MWLYSNHIIMYFHENLLLILMDTENIIIILILCSIKKFHCFFMEYWFDIFFSQTILLS